MKRLLILLPMMFIASVSFAEPLADSNSSSGSLSGAASQAGAIGFIDQSVNTSTVDAVYTLCAEEVCPFFPGDVIRVHWGMSDPAASPAGKDEPDINDFRKVRDELIKRLEVLFA